MEKRQISFNEALHRYTDEYNLVYTSVTTLIGQVEPKYDEEFWAMYRILDQAGYKLRPLLEDRLIMVNYQGVWRKYTIAALQLGIIPTAITTKQVKGEWTATKEEACEWGTNKHSFLEVCINKITDTTQYTIDSIKSTTESQGFAFKVTNLKELEESPLRVAYPTIYKRLVYFINQGWIIYAEKRVYSAKHRIAGTIDLLLVRNGECFIIDWKTNRKMLKFEAGYYQKEWLPDRSKKIETDKWVPKKDTLLSPLERVSHCKGSIYTLQLSAYHYLCYLWGLTPVGTLLVHIRPRCDDKGVILLDSKGDRLEHAPEFYDIPIWKSEIKDLFNWHKNKLTN